MNESFDWKALQNGSDIRGVALPGMADESVNITPDVAQTVAIAFAEWLMERLSKPISELHFAIGRDSRLSGPDLSDAMSQALSGLGGRVYDTGLASTPAMFMTTVTPGWECDGAIMLTASHLPFNRNGFKFFTSKGGLESGDIHALLEKAQALAESAESQATSVMPAVAVETVDFMAVYAAGLVKMIREGVQHPQHYDTPLKGLKIVVDAGNGAGGFFVDQVLHPLGADTTGSQFLEPDGRFPNHIPNPENAEAMQALREAVLTQNADFGIIFDTDVDRSAAVDHRGEELNRNRLIALISAIILKAHPGSTIVTDSVTSEGLHDFIENTLQGRHHRFKRGYRNVINEGLRLNADGEACWLAIETSGHAALKENYFLDDGAYLVSRLLIALAKAKAQGRDLSHLIESLREPQESREQRYKITRDDFKEYGQTVLQQLETFVAAQSDWHKVTPNYEGVRVQCSHPAEQGWFLLRLSLHDPVLALNIESEQPGGVDSMASRLDAFLNRFDGLKKA